MGLLDNHPYTAVTAIINRAVDHAEPSPDDGLIEMELPELLQAIKAQKNLSEPGPTEAARAIRKKLKYGSYTQQYNALKLYELLVANGGVQLSKLYNDSRLLDRMKSIITGADTTVDPKIKKTAKIMVIGWHNEYDGSRDRQGLVELFRQVGLKSKNGRSRKSSSVVPDFMNDTPFEETYEDPRSSGTVSARRDSDYDSLNDYEESISDATSSYVAPVGPSSKKLTNKELDKKFRIPKINYEKETPKIFQTIAEANILATNLTNTLKSLEKNELSIHSPKANEGFDECRQIRRKILTYLQLVNKEELLGALLKCNDELVTALKFYETKSEFDDDDIDSLQYYDTDDSLSEPESASVAATEDYRVPSTAARNPDLDIPIKKKVPPPIPPKSPRLKGNKPTTGISQKLEPKVKTKVDDDNPFGDENETQSAVAWS